MGDKQKVKELRLIVKTWDERQIIGYEKSDMSKAPLTVHHTPIWHLTEQLYPGAQLNLLDIEKEEDGTLCPRLFILEPDYLVDITTICQCVKPSGTTPLHYLMAKFMPREDTLAIQLGNVANQFLDDAINREDSFQHSMHKSFNDYALKYCTLEGINEVFFQHCKTQFQNLQRTVKEEFPRHGIDITNKGAQLEPAFICEALGLQGRLDLLTNDLHKIVELKSGKRDEFHNTFKTEHAWQMALYKEILHYSLGLPREEISTLLLYSHYPQIYDINLGQDSISAALAIRNGIVHIDRILRENSKDFLLSLTEDDFNPLHATGKLYQNYIRPRIMSFLNTLHNASPIEIDYFCTMLSFVQREQYYAKVGDERPASNRAFARAWLCDDNTKILDGNMVAGLTLTPLTNNQDLLTHIVAQLPENEGNQSNFREGDGIILYEHEWIDDKVIFHQSIRCHIEEIRPDAFLLKLDHPQHGKTFIHDDKQYAIEPSYSDSLFASQYRGLYALLSCPRHRRELILGLRPPTPNDLYLLVGPPGSGKTSITLRGMVEKFLNERPDQSILLMAYTNRAVDEICQALESISPTPTYLRIGQEASCDHRYRARLLPNIISPCQNRRELLQTILSIRIVCGTVSSLCSTPELFKLKQFHTSILDEASQVLEPQFMPLLCITSADGKMGIGKLIMIGDHKQLPAVVVQPSQESKVSSSSLIDIGLQNCRDSLFERLYRQAEQHKYQEIDGMLTCQGRMHESISHFVNLQYYEGRLGTIPLPHQTAGTPWPKYNPRNCRQQYIATHRMGMFDVQDLAIRKGEKTNENEAKEVAELVTELHQLSQLNGEEWHPTTQIGIIVPFRGQISLIRKKLEKTGISNCQQITIDTVERYQGSQRDIIIFSTVVRDARLLEVLSVPAEVGGITIDRKLNVAITRARKQFFLIGQLSLLKQSPDYRELIEYISSLPPSQ